MATTRRAMRYPVLPRKPKPKAGYSQQLAEEAAKVYSEIVDGEAIVTYRWPGWKNAENVIEMGLASLAEVAKQRVDPKAAMQAGLWLVEYGNRQLEKSGRSADGAAIMNQLEALYKRALPGAEGEPLVVNVEEEKEGR